MWSNEETSLHAGRPPVEIALAIILPLAVGLGFSG
jgi:hypothetical protein